jgi:hypothetical protein
MTKHYQHEPQPAGEIGRPPGHEELLDTLERPSVEYSSAPATAPA